MERYFSLHNIMDDMTKLWVEVLYLDQEEW